MPESAPQTRAINLEREQIVAWADPEAGNHGHQCPWLQERWYIGPIERIHVRNGRTEVFLTGGVHTVPEDANLQDPPKWLLTRFERSDYTTFMWYEQHKQRDGHSIEHRNCDWGPTETERVEGE